MIDGSGSGYGSGGGSGYGCGYGDGIGSGSGSGSGDGSTSKVVNVRYNTLTQPTSSSAKGLSAILNSWL